MRTSLDVLRSTKKYLAATALTGFELRFDVDEGTFKRPFARLGWTTPTSSKAVGPFHVELRRTMQVVCWPEEKEKPDAAVVEAERVQDLLFRAFCQGLHSPSFSGLRAHPMCIPLWDYSSRALSAAADDTNRDAYDFVRVVELPDIGYIPDPNTEHSRLVIANVRLRWTRSVAQPETGAEVETVGVAFDP